MWLSTLLKSRCFASFALETGLHVSVLMAFCWLCIFLFVCCSSLPTSQRFTELKRRANPRQDMRVTCFHLPLYAWIVKQYIFSCPWFHSVGGESTTMIGDEGAGWFFPRWAPHGRWLFAAISLSAGVSVNPTLAPGILNARWRELSLKS